MIEWLHLANEALMSFATNLEGTVWFFLILWAFIALDGIVPVFPSESLVIAVIALSMSTGHPNVWLVFLVAIAGAFCGDLAAYSLGRYVHKKNFAFLQHHRIKKILDWAQKWVSRRPAPVIISARYIPIGRVAVNFTAGRMQFPRPSFALLIAIAAVTWAGYSSLIGMGAGAWLEGHPVIAVCAGVAGGVLIGLLVDQIIRRVFKFEESHPQLAPPRALTTAGKNSRYRFITRRNR